MNGADPQVLYRMYDSAGELLYVGVSVNFRARVNAHRREKAWWGEVATIKLQHHPSRADVLAAERESILLEQPQHNIVGNEPDNSELDQLMDEVLAELDAEYAARQQD